MLIAPMTYSKCYITWIFEYLMISLVIHMCAIYVQSESQGIVTQGIVDHVTEV